MKINIIKILVLSIFSIFTACAQKVPAKLKPQAVLPPGTTSASISVPAVSYWKLAKLASDDETLKTRQALIQADRTAILVEICHSAGISNLDECKISPDAKTVTREKKK